MLVLSHLFLPGKCIFIIANLLLIDLCVRISRDYRQKNRISAQEIKITTIRMILIVFAVILSLCIDLFTVSALLPLTGITSFL